MKIIDNTGKTIDNPDLTKGYLVEDKLLVAHHPKQNGKREKGHYEPTYFVFDDGEVFRVISLDDPHIKGLDYVFLDGETPKQIIEIGQKYIVDSPKVEPVAAWDEYEKVQRYIPYTDEELRERQEREAFLNQGYSLLQELQTKSDKQTETLNLLAALLQQIANK